MSLVTISDIFSQLHMTRFRATGSSPYRMYLPRRSRGFPNALQRTREFYLCALCLKEGDFGIVRVKEVSEERSDAYFPKSLSLGHFSASYTRLLVLNLYPLALKSQTHRRLREHRAIHIEKPGHTCLYHLTILFSIDSDRGTEEAVSVVLRSRMLIRTD